MDIPTLIHRKAGNAQVGLSYFFLAGFFACLILQGLGYIKTDLTGQLAPMAMLVLSFWFQRQRTTGEEPGKKSNPDPTQPPQAAKSNL